MILHKLAYRDKMHKHISSIEQKHMIAHARAEYLHSFTGMHALTDYTIHMSMFPTSKEEKEFQIMADFNFFIL